MTIVVTGGGSGGHITPILAVAAELKRLDPNTKVVFIGQKDGHLVDIVEADQHIDASYFISAGKFRRYYDRGLSQLFDLSIQRLNLRDLFATISGLGQSWRVIGKIKPDMVFTRGGYVSVPVAVASWFRRVPFMTHDSDSMPSLANRLIAPLATLHLVALDPSIYPYPLDKTVRVGVPINSEYRPVSLAEQAKYKELLGFHQQDPMIMVTGGGNGAETLNNQVVANAGFLLKRYPKLRLVHISGRLWYESVQKRYNKLPKDQLERVVVKDFVSDLYRYSGAADVVIARGGATNIAEFAAQGKACIMIPAKQLVWTINNVHILAKQGAVISLSEDQADQELRLGNTVSSLLDDKKVREELMKKIAQIYVPDAAVKIAKLLLQQTENGRS
jgi:UDP-N-acetylglucosamine--N-acetylmuramyl-(pentapeptide) pyrophosphoryl-undecaprenol N-acetylglucosamine transferase